MFLTIAIPSYNRPDTLIELLQSIDFISDDIEIIICEDNSPKRNEIRTAIEKYQQTTNVCLNYFENEFNLGYDENLWELVRKSKGEYILFMGDDDEFCPNSLKEFYSFLKSNSHLGYVLKSHIVIRKDNSVESFNYYKTTTFFDKGESSIIELFRKSVLISGFCIKKEGLLNYYTKELNGSLLIQLFYLAVQCQKYDSAYFKIPLTVQKEKDTVPYFGASETEKHLYTSGTNTVNGSLNFMRKYIAVLDYIDNILSVNVKLPIVKTMSKYFFPVLSVHRDKGINVFSKYAYSLSKMGYNVSFYFYLYFFALFFLGKKNCERLILFIKSKLKYTPHL